jgi:hypothetical protein
MELLNGMTIMTMENTTMSTKIEAHSVKEVIRAT